MSHAENNSSIDWRIPIFNNLYSVFPITILKKGNIKWEHFIPSFYFINEVIQIIILPQKALTIKTKTSNNRPK